MHTSGILMLKISVCLINDYAQLHMSYWKSGYNSNCGLLKYGIGNTENL